MKAGKILKSCSQTIPEGLVETWHVNQVFASNDGSACKGMVWKFIFYTICTEKNAKQQTSCTIALRTDPVKLVWILNVSVFKYHSLFWQRNPSLFQSCLGTSVFAQVNTFDS